MEETDLRNSLIRAKKYLSIIENLERTEQFTIEQENWLFKNCRLLQDEMDGLKFKQLEPGMKNGFGRPLMRIRDIISTFPSFLKGGFPMDESYIFSAIKTNLNGYIQKIEELLKNTKKLKRVIKEKEKKISRIIEFDKIKAIELIFLGLYITSIILLINDTTFILGFIMNIISVLTILIISLINWEEI